MEASLRFFFLFVICTTIVPAHADYVTTVLNDRPIAYFRFEEDAGATSIADSTGNGNDSADLVAIGSGVLGETGAIGKAALFGGDGHIVTGLTFDPSLGDFSIEAIVNLTPDVPGQQVFVGVNGNIPNRDMMLESVKPGLWPGQIPQPGEIAAVRAGGNELASATEDDFADQAAGIPQ